MPRGDRDRDRKRTNRDLARRAKKRVCIFCKEHIEWVDYKDVNLLRRFMSDRGKIRARRVSGNCAQHQREVAVAIKTARELALLPYSQRTTTERTGPRGMRGAPPPPAAPAGDAAGADDEPEVGDVAGVPDELADVAIGDEIDAGAADAVEVEAPAE